MNDETLMAGVSRVVAALHVGRRDHRTGPLPDELVDDAVDCLIRSYLRARFEIPLEPHYAAPPNREVLEQRRAVLHTMALDSTQKGRADDGC